MYSVVVVMVCSIRSGLVGYYFLTAYVFPLQVEHGFKAVHIQGVEFMHMGQQSMGHYPVHFHMNGDVDERGGYNPATYVKDLSIHHSFSRCVTIHGTNGLLVSHMTLSGLLSINKTSGETMS